MLCFKIIVLWIHFILIWIRIRIRGSISGDYGSGSGSGSEVVLTLWISFSLVNVLQCYNSYKLYLVYIPKCKKNRLLTKKIKILKEFFFSSYIYGQFWFFMEWFWVSFWRYPDPDPYRLKWIRIRIRPNDMDPTGSGSGSGSTTLYRAHLQVFQSPFLIR